MMSCPPTSTTILSLVATFRFPSTLCPFFNSTTWADATRAIKSRMKLVASAHRIMFVTLLRHTLRLPSAHKGTRGQRGLRAIPAPPLGGSAGRYRAGQGAQELRFIADPRLTASSGKEGRDGQRVELTPAVARPARTSSPCSCTAQRGTAPGACTQSL